MSKELEKIKVIKFAVEHYCPREVDKSFFESIEQSLQRLEAIDNSKPSEALDCLDKLMTSYCEECPINSKQVSSFCKTCYYNQNYSTIKQYILKAQDQEELLKSGNLSDGYHTFNQLYYQRCILFASLVRLNKDKSWKSFKHSDGKYCFDSNGEWFIVGIDTPIGSYTYHYEKKYWDLFECQELECSKEWDGHTEEDVSRLLSLSNEQESKIEILKEYRKDYLSRLKNLEEYSLKQDRVLEIIKEKNVDIHWIKKCKTLDEYNDMLNTWELELTQEEFDLLKEVFSSEQNN